jgi:thiosulfate dehydrogenase
MRQILTRKLALVGAGEVPMDADIPHQPFRISWRGLTGGRRGSLLQSDPCTSGTNSSAAWMWGCVQNVGQLSPLRRKYQMNLVTARDHKSGMFVATLLLSSGLCTFGIQQAAAATPQLEKAIQDGKALFVHETFGGNGMTCQSCHANGGVGPGKMPNGAALPSLSNAATIFPRFNSKSGKVMTLEDQLRNCIKGGLGGKPPAYGSKQLTQLVTYVSSLARGKPLDMGGKPQ